MQTSCQRRGRALSGVVSVLPAVVIIPVRSVIIVFGFQQQVFLAEQVGEPVDKFSGRRHKPFPVRPNRCGYVVSQNRTQLDAHRNVPAMGRQKFLQRLKHLVHGAAARDANVYFAGKLFYRLVNRRYFVDNDVYALAAAVSGAGYEHHRFGLDEMRVFFVCFGKYDGVAFAGEIFDGEHRHFFAG